ncbi:unnamed protein product [Musa hybrid cultivar]
MVASSKRVECFADDTDLEASPRMPTPDMMDMEVHKVAVLQDRTGLRSFRHSLSEVFFPDDPLHRFKNKPFFKKVVLALQYFFPIFDWGAHYNLKLLKSDAVAGITIASLAIPQGISYAKLAGLPPIIGLYSSFVPPLIYSVLGSSRDLACGPLSIASLVMGSMLRDVVSPEDTKEYLEVAFTATFFAGVFQAGLGLLRLGFIIDFLSKPTLTGFMGGAAVLVSLQQLKGLLGIVHFTTKMAIIPVLKSVFDNRKEWSWQAVVMGLSFLVLLLTARHISTVRPKLFWVSAAAPLTSVIISTIISYVFRSHEKGISTIGYLPEGVNPSSVSMLHFKGPHSSLALKTGIVSGLLALTEGIAVGRTFASMKNYQIDGNKEMVAVGSMNLAGSCVSCYVTSGGFARSAVNFNAGCKTAATNIIMASVVLFTMLLLMPLFHYTPNVILSAIIISAVIGLIDVRGAILLWKVDKFDFLACMTAFLGVLLLSVPIGLGISVGISVLKILFHATRPNIAVMGNIPGTNSYRDLAQYKDAKRMPSFLILGIESPVYFTNSVYLQERILRWIREEEERITNSNESPLKCIILDMAVASLGEQHLKISVMGKSPAKWIKAVIFGKRSSRSHTSKGKDGLKPGVDKEHFSGGEPSHVTMKSLVITQPVLVSNNSSGPSSENRTDSTLVTGAVRVESQEIVVHQASSNRAKALEERAATKVQAAFRGYQSRRVFCALKGIIRLQALIRGHLVRRQAVTTLHCMWGIVRFQALVRGQRVRLSGIGLEVRTKYPQMKSVDDKKLDFSKMQLSANQFVCKLLSALPVTKPVQIHYDPVEPNSVFSWLERWTSSQFWYPLPQSKKSVNVKSWVRCSSAVESESVRLKSNVHKNVAAKVDVMTESERHKRVTRKMLSPPADSVVENPQSEIEKVKRSLRKVSNSKKEPAEKPESENQKPTCTPRKVTNSLSDAPQVSNEHSSMKIKKDSVVSIDSKLEIVAAVKSVASGGPKNAVIDDSTAIKPHSPEEICKEESISNCDGELSLKDEPTSNEIQKSSKRRASFPPKPEPFAENASQNAPRLPSYMATTESAKAKLRGQVSPRVGSDSAERYNMPRRHSLPTSTNGKLNLQSSRAHKLIQASCKDGIRNDRSFTSSRDGSEKSIQVGWRR